MKQLGSQFGSGGTGLYDGTLRKALLELQSLKTVVIDGAAADTDIAVAGIKTTDTIQSAIMYDAGVPSDVKANVAITAAGKVQTDVSTASKKIVLSYYVSQ